VNWRGHRLLIAAILTSAAVLVPCAAWFVAGNRTAQREAKSISSQPIQAAELESSALAQRLAGRLEGIRADESHRPFYHYQRSYHDPTSSCQCESITPSPLAQGLNDPLIEAHFQIDPHRDLTLPTLHGDWPEQVTRTWFEEQKSLLNQLEGAAVSCRELVNAGEVQPRDINFVISSEDAEFHVEPNDPSVKVGAFRWATLELDAKPTLVALRRVGTSKGDLVQGFLVDNAAVRAWMQPTSLPTHFRPASTPTTSSSPSPQAIEAPVDLSAVRWVVSADLAAATKSASLDARQIIREFQRSFAFGATTATLAAIVVLFLLWQADRMARQRSRFAAAAAHELRTPLASLRLYGEMLADETLGDPTKRGEYARRVADEAERLGRVVTNVLSFTRLERASIQANLIDGDLGAAVHECVDRLRQPIEAAGAELIEKLDADLRLAKFDPETLFHIVQNLVDNAEKYTRGAENRAIEVILKEEGRWLQLAVRDHGSGLSDPSNIFDPFVRGCDPDSPAGLGLGLSLVHSLAKTQGGNVRVENAEGGGARFIVEFACA
jgi:signal transduction histidine kinase